LQFLLAHAPEQADVVGLFRLLAALLSELALLAVAVERQPRRFSARLETLHLVQHLFRLAVEFGVQPDLAQPPLGAAGDQPYSGPQALDAGQGQPEDAQHQFLVTADVVPVLAEDG
jgi:hypothetical protein